LTDIIFQYKISLEITYLNITLSLLKSILKQ